MNAAPLPSNLPALTSLRFFAALMVLAYHYTLVWAPDAQAASGLLQKGYLGVDFFFVLSGFILTHVYLAAREGGRFRFDDFIWARLARIYPLHFVTTLIAIVVLAIGYRIGAIADDPVYLSYVVKTLAMVHAWGTTDHFGLNEPSWSISAEWAAYLAFPLYLVLVVALRKRPIAFTLAALGALVGADALARAALGKPLTQLAFDFGILRIAPEFLLGCALYTLALRLPLSATAARGGLAASIVATLALLHFQGPDLVTIVAMGAVILFAAAGARNAAPASNLGHPALVYLGEISYAIYLVHRIVEHALIDVFAPLTGIALPVPVLFLIATLSTLLIAAALHHVIEKPFRQWMRALPPSRWLGQTPAAQRD